MAFDVEQIFGAVDIILNQRLQDVSFDKTLICTIVDDSDKKNGHYIVTDGTIKFDAYVSDATYKTDDQVRVSVLGGDFSDKKFITGKYVADENTGPITYMSPLEGIIPITGNLFTKGADVFSIKANGTPSSKVLWNVNLIDDVQFRDLQSNGIYNTITLKADFKTLLSHYNLRSGNFGLRLDLFIQPSLNSTKRIHKWVALDSSEFFGNPYAFSIYSTQGKKINIASTGVIAEMALWLYQGVDGDGNDSLFMSKKGEILNPNRIVNGEPVQLDDDILVKNIEIGFGSDISLVSDNTLKLYTYSTPTYLYENHTAETNEKEMELLWYNKTDNNEYVGFSDGIYDLNYDEIDYLKIAHKDSRLIAQLGREGIPTDEAGLTLAADIQEAKPLMIAATDNLTKDLNSVVRAFSAQVQAVDTFKNLLGEILHTTTGTIITNYNAAFGALNDLSTAYEGILRFACDKQMDVKNKSTWKETYNHNYYTTFKNAFTAVFEKINTVLIAIDEQTRADATHSGYRGIYDTYDTRIRKEIGLIQEKLKQIDDILKDNHSKLQAYKVSDYVFNEYERKNFDEFANKYCIYWYRFKRGYKLEYDATEGANNDEYQFGRFVGDNWERLHIVDDDENEIKNLGVPRDENQTTIIDGKTYYPPKALNQKLIRYMNNRTQEEKYLAVLFYNHEMYQSNIITFTNSEDVPDEYLVDQRDALRIEHDVLSFEHYQSYDVTNMLINSADGGRVRQLKCFYDGLFSKDEALIDAGLYWYVPNSATMLTVDKDYLIKEGFSTDADLPEGERSDKSRSGFTYFYKKVGKSDTPAEGINPDGSKYTYDTSNGSDRCFFYKIKPYYEQAASKNTIEVYAYLPNVTEPIKGEISFTFSTFGTNGTKYTLAITPATSQIAVIGAPSYTEVKLDAETYEPNVYYEPDGDNYKLATGEFMSSKTYYTVAANHSLPLEVSLRDASNNLIPMVDGTVADNKDTAYAFKTSWMGPTTYIAHATDSNGDGNMNSIIVTRDTQHDANKYYYGILKANVQFKLEREESEANDKVEQYQKYQVVDLNALYSIPYSSSGLYYISGPTSIVYNNQGVVSHMSEDPFCLYTVNDKTNEAVAGQKWRVEYYDKDGNWIDNTHSDWDVMLNYMPVLNSENGLTAAPMYMVDLPYYPVAICESSKGDILWVQPIIITQNRYASSTLNDWNGSLTIDEKNGTILSTMVGAGKKEDDNSFSGILMGDIATGANFDHDNFGGLGIYGFNRGAQSLAMTIDGKAFFGKAGRGRIYFDGDSGTISSASYQQQRTPKVRDDGSVEYDHFDTAGMLIDLDDGFIDMKGTAVNETNYSPKVSMLSEEEYRALWTDNGEEYTGDYAQYVADFEKDATTVEHKQSHIRIDVKGGNQHNNNDPYFLIHSANQPKADKHLMFVGDNEYYLQTDDYKPTVFQFEDRVAPFVEGQGPNKGPGAGFKLDLKNSLIDAYKLKITSKNLFINSSDDGNPYFIIKSDDHDTIANEKYRNLMYVDDSRYYLQSADFKTMDTVLTESEWNALSEKEYSSYTEYKKSVYMGSGMKIIMRDPLLKPGIEAYNFVLRSGSTGDATHRIILQDKSPYFTVNTNVGTTDTPRNKSLAVIGDNDFYFQSADYSPEEKNASGAVTKKGSGMLLSLSDKILTAYSGFTLKAFQPLEDGTSSNSYILLDAKANDYPFVVYGGGSISYTTGYKENGEAITESATKQFRVNWDGSLDAVGGSFKGAINATSGYITGNLDVVGSLTGGKIIGAGIYGSVIANDQDLTKATFHVTSGGHITATSATIGGWQVSGSSSGFSNNGLYMSPSTGLGFGDNFSVDASGNLKANGASLNALTVYQSLTVNSSSISAAGSGAGGGGGNDGPGTGGGSSNPNQSIKARAAVVAPDGGGGGGETPAAALVTINGNTSIGGNTTIDGTVTVGSDGKKTSLTINGTSTITGNTKISGKTAIGGAEVNEAYDLTLSGDINIGGQLSIDGATTSTCEATEINIDAPYEAGYKITVHNGIITNIEPLQAGWIDKVFGTGDNAVGVSKTDFEAFKESLGALAYVDSIKKKVNITMSGSYTVPMSGYYTIGEGETVCRYTDAAAYARAWRYCYYYNGKVYGPVSKVPSYAEASSDGFYIAYDDGNDYVINDGSLTYYPVTAASNQTINLTGSKTLTNQEFVASDTDDDIDFTVSGITFTVPT